MSIKSSMAAHNEKSVISAIGRLIRDSVSSLRKIRPVTFFFFLNRSFLQSIVIYSHLKHLHTKPNEPKCIRYARIGPRLCESEHQETRYSISVHRCGEGGVGWGEYC